MPLSVIQYRVDARILRTYAKVDTEHRFSEVARDNAPDELKKDGELDFEYVISSGESTDTQIETDGNLKLKDITETFGFNAIKYINVCKKKPRNNQNFSDESVSGRNIVNVLMMRQCVPDKKTSSSGVKDGGLSRPDQMYNNLIDMCEKNGWLFNSKVQGEKVLKVICDTMWYVVDCRKQLEDAYKQYPTKITNFPFDLLENCVVEPPTKKTKKSLNRPVLQEHSSTLEKVLELPVLKLERMAKLNDVIEKVKDSLNSYADYLQSKNERMQIVHAMSHPAREVSKDITAEFRSKCTTVAEWMLAFDEKVNNSEPWEPVLFEAEDLGENVEKYSRCKFFKELKLSSDIYIFRYNSGANLMTTSYVVKVPNGCPQNEMTTQLTRLGAIFEKTMPEYHTRYMKKQLKLKVSRLAKVPSHVLDFIYKDLSGDATLASDKGIRQRIELAIQGDDEDLIIDLRHKNTGRKPVFEPFFSVMEKVVDEVATADERRNNICHMSEFLSIKHIIEKTKERLANDDIPIPSHSWVGLQFVPRNRYTNAALKYTSRIKVINKIQVRRLRLSHPDAHFVAAYFKYLRERASTLREHCAVMFMDDKAKIPVGEPGNYVSTGVRVHHAVPTPINSTIGALDHDMQSKGKITPSVIMIPNIPEDPLDSWYQGQVHITLQDSVFDGTDCFKYAAMSIERCRAMENMVPVLFKFSDGGTEHRNILIKPQLSYIAIFKKLNLDFLVAMRTAPGQSWLNPVERTMSLINLGLQNVATARDDCSREVEERIKKCKSMKDLRGKLDEDDKAAWQVSISTVILQLKLRLQNLELNDEAFHLHEPVGVDEVVETLNDLFPSVDLAKITKANAPKVVTDWIDKHCRLRHYAFQCRKCDDISCCLPPITTTEMRQWIPDPVMAEDGEHYKSLQSLIGTATTDNARPGKNPIFKKGKQAQVAPDNVFMEDDISNQNPQLFKAQHARGSIECTECMKPRCIFSYKNNLTQPKFKLAIEHTKMLSDYTCGSFVLDPDEFLVPKVQFGPNGRKVYPPTDIPQCRLNLTCGDPVELQYYSAKLGRADVCAFCACSGATVDNNLKLEWKTVLPICENCKASGLEAIRQNKAKK